MGMWSQRLGALLSDGEQIWVSAPSLGLGAVSWQMFPPPSVPSVPVGIYGADCVGLCFTGIQCPWYSFLLPSGCNLEFPEFIVMLI